MYQSSLIEWTILIAHSTIQISLRSSCWGSCQLKPHLSALTSNFPWVKSGTLPKVILILFGTFYQMIGQSSSIKWLHNPSLGHISRLIQFQNSSWLAESLFRLHCSPVSLFAQFSYLPFPEDADPESTIQETFLYANLWLRVGFQKNPFFSIELLDFSYSQFFLFCMMDNRVYKMELSRQWKQFTAKYPANYLEHLNILINCWCSYFLCLPK